VDDAGGIADIHAARYTHFSGDARYREHREPWTNRAPLLPLYLCICIGACNLSSA